MGLSSCQEVGQETIEAVQEEKFEQLDPVGYESKPKVYPDFKIDGLQETSIKFKF
jgi:hypothetical protein